MLKRLLYFIVLAIIQLLLPVAVQAADTPSLEEDIEEQPAKAIAYRYWIDDNVNAKTTEAYNGTDILQNIDISSFNTGIHVYHIQFKSEESGWGPTQDVTFYISNPNTDTKEEDGIAPVTQYEYWINQTDRSNPIRYEKADIRIEASTANLPAGENSYLISAKDNKGRRTFYSGSFNVFYPTSEEEDIQEEPVQAVAYRYWLDDNSNQKQEASIGNPEDVSCHIDVANLEQGAHTFHLELKGNDGKWYSADYTYFYAGERNQDVKEEEASPVVKYEYWFDELTKFASKTFEKPDMAIEEDLSGFAAGKHTFTISAIDDKGMRSFSVGSFLLIDNNVEDDEEEEIAQPAIYQYWIDNDREHATNVAYTTEFSATIDVASIPGGAHTFNLRIKDSDNIWGPTNQYAFYTSSANSTEPVEVQQPITGYRYGVNGKSTTKELTEVDNIPSLSVEIPFPTAQELTSVENYEFTTDNASREVGVKRFGNLYYFIQFKDKAGNWSGPVAVDSLASDSTIRTAKELQLQRTLGIRKLGTGDYDIAKFTITDNNAYYFGASESCNVMLYQDNSRLMTLTPEQMVSNKTTLLAPGTYFAIIYNQKQDGSIRLTGSKDWASDPVFSYADHQLTISSDTPGAQIHYTLDGSMPTSESTIYTAPIEMTGNTRVRAMACADGMSDSFIKSYLVGDFDTQDCADPVANYDGRKVTLTTNSQNADIYYTLDGSTPTTQSQLYNIDAGIAVTEAGIIKAFATMDLMNDSKVITFEVPSYYDGNETVSIKTAGNLATAFDWCGGKPLRDTLNVVGNVNAADFAAVAKMSNLKVLDMSAAKPEGGTIGDLAFAGTNLVYVSLPASLTTCGKEIFANSSKLAAVRWNTNATLPANMLDGINNPNLLLYVNTKSAVPAGIGNVIASGVAENIVLSVPEGEETGNFFCPKAFTAQKISYTRNFTQETEVGVCQGWETLTLPFNVATITHETNGAIAPFAKGSKSDKPFWLYELSTEAGFRAASSIKANTPYIISMPNSQAYSDEYILSGKVTFAATNAMVSATTAASSKNESREFVACYNQTEKAEGIYALNVGEEYQGYRPGSIFAENFKQVKPFEAYLTTAQAAQTFSRQFGSSTTGIGMIPLKPVYGLKAWSHGSTLYLQSDKARSVMVFNTMGMLMKKVDVEAGETTAVTDLPSGIYIVNNKKVAIK